MVGSFAGQFPRFTADTAVLGQGDWIVCEAGHIRRGFFGRGPRNGFTASGLVTEQGWRFEPEKDKGWPSGLNNGDRAMARDFGYWR
jgi:hypothetical protein